MAHELLGYSLYPIAASELSFVLSVLFFFVIEEYKKKKNAAKKILFKEKNFWQNYDQLKWGRPIGSLLYYQIRGLGDGECPEFDGLSLLQLLFYLVKLKVVFSPQTCL